MTTRRKRSKGAKLGEGIYTAADAARILNIPYRKSRHWFDYHVKYKLFDTIGHRYHFELRDTVAVNFLTLIEMVVFYSLKDRKVKTKKIIEAHSVMSEYLNTPYPFAKEDVYSLGGVLLFENLSNLVVADKTLQITIPNFLEPLAQKIEFGHDKLATRYYPLGKNKTIVVNPENQFGRPRIDGTNILPETIYDLHLGGDSKKFIAELYNISVRNVDDAIEFSTRKAA